MRNIQMVSFMSGYVLTLLPLQPTVSKQANAAKVEAQPAKAQQYISSVVMVSDRKFNTMSNLASLREEFTKGILKRSDLLGNPISQFGLWLRQAIEAKCLNPNALSLATVSKDGMPNVRVVLLKDFNTEGFVFFTNYDSQKGQELAHNPRACLNFFWGELERQVRIKGSVCKIAETDSDHYFQSRPRESQLGAVASPQSEVLNTETALEDTYLKLLMKFSDQPIMRPRHWGGYRLQAEQIEFWQGRANRMHDRFRYSKQGRDWQIDRIAP